MTTSRSDSGLFGVLLAAGGALAYGVTTVIGRGLAAAGVTSATALGIRFALAALVLASLLKVRGAPLLPLPGERLRIVLLGAVGYTLESTLFYLSLQRGTAAACILLFYAYPAIVTAIELVRGRERLTPATGAALALSVAGTAIVVTSGGTVSISFLGIVLALSAATAYAVYLVVGREFGRRTDAMTAACWVAIGASGSSLVRGVITGTHSDPSGHLLPLAGYGVATAAAFGLTFAALGRLGASQTAVIGTLEALSTVVLASLVLGEAITLAQAVGGLAVISAAGVIAWSHRPAPRRTLPQPPVRPPAELVLSGVDGDDVEGHLFVVRSAAPEPDARATQGHGALGP